MRHARVSESLLSAAVACCEWGVSTLCALLLYHGKAGAWPSVATLARATGKSPDRVRKALHEFVQAGILLASDRLRPDRSRTSTCYALAGRFRCDGIIDENAPAPPLRRHYPPLASTQGGSEQSNEQRKAPLSPPAAATLERRPAGGEAPPPAPPSDLPVHLDSPAGERSARLAVWSAWCVLYRAKVRRPYLPKPRGDRRALALLVSKAIADGCADVPAALAWCAAYLAEYLGRATGRAAERRFPLRYAPALDWLCAPGAIAPPTVYREPAPIVGRGATPAEVVRADPALAAIARSLGCRVRVA